MAVAVSARGLNRRRRDNTLAVITTKIDENGIVGMSDLSGFRK